MFWLQFLPCFGLFRLFVCFIELSALSLLCLCPQPGRTRAKKRGRVAERERATGTGKSAESNNLLSNSRWDHVFNLKFYNLRAQCLFYCVCQCACGCVCVHMRVYVCVSVCECGGGLRLQLRRLPTGRQQIPIAIPSGLAGWLPSSGTGKWWGLRREWGWSCCWRCLGLFAHRVGISAPFVYGPHSYQLTLVCATVCACVCVYAHFAYKQFVLTLVLATFLCKK